MHAGSKATAQNPLEYMTAYGWALVIMTVVLAALVYLGAFNGNTASSAQECIPQVGYLCTTPQLSTAGNLNVALGQIGANITLTGLACSNTGMPSAFAPINSVVLYDGQQMELTFKCPLASNAIGTPFTGNLYIEYNSGPYIGLVSKVATVSAKST